MLSSSSRQEPTLFFSLGSFQGTGFSVGSDSIVGSLAGLAINPSTAWPENLQVFSKCDLVLVMSVEAGFGGKPLMPSRCNGYVNCEPHFGDRMLLEIDGGVNTDTIRSCSEAGADLLVVGSAIFRHADYCQAISRLESAMHAVS